MNLKVISRNVGFALLVSALFMFLSILVSFGNGRDSALAALMISFVITFTVGIFPFIFVRRSSGISLHDGYMIIFLSWILSFIFGMLPYLLWGGPFSVVNAWFESVSGFTTTGATILDNIEQLPNSLLFWRSSTHFIGGLGVVVFLLLIIPSSSPVKLRLTNMELSSLSREGYRTHANRMVYIFTFVYLGIGIAAFLCYWLAGMSPFDAINHAMSVCAAGGFSTRNLSIGYYQSDLINLITIVFMLLASIHFGLIYMAIASRSLKPLNNPVLKAYLGSILLVALSVSISLKLQHVDATWDRSLMDGFFHVVSYASTTGFAISDNAAWPLLPSILMLVVGIQCGMAGSTTGGLKTDRVLVLFKSIHRQVRRSVHPSSVAEIKLGNTILHDEDTYPHILYIALFLMLAMLSVLICLIVSNDNQNAIAGSISMLTNVGPSIGEIGTYGNYNAEPAAIKVVFTADMFFGRIEIYPILAVFSMIFSRSRK